MEPKSLRKYLLLSIVALVILRLLLNAYVPLMDKTEARYAEIARIMLETDNWTTPQVDYGVPFWAKPPLSTWLSAMSMKVFGVNEFAVRLPYLLASLLLMFLVSKFANPKNPVYLTGFVLLTIPEFLLHAGVVSTDTLLALCIAMVFLSFWKAILFDRLSYWGYLMFAFIGLGLLAKGPIVLILTAPPIFIWTVYSRSFKVLFKRIPLVSGTILALAIAAPWYWQAEMATEGFLDYFIVGEHFKRFFDSGWDGDKYGFAKVQPMGIIWLFLLAFALPWIQILIYRLWKNRASFLKDPWVVFLLLWILWTPFFFTFSKSLIHTYILPSMVPVALLIDHYWSEMKRQKTILIASLVFPALIVVAALVSTFSNTMEHYSNTDKYLLQQVDLENEKVYYFDIKSYSSQFYSRGQVQSVSAQELREMLVRNEAFKIIIPNKRLNQIPAGLPENLTPIGVNVNGKIYTNMKN